MKIIAVVGGLLAVVAAPLPAQEISQRLATVPVSTSDLIDGRPSLRLENRIKLAIENVCGSNADSLDQYVATARCRKAARTEIDRQLAAIARSAKFAARSR